MIPTVEGLQNDLLEALKENTELKIENQLLREKVENLSAKQKPKVKQDGLAGLRKIYQSGFHICNMYYGSHRLENEECVFCLSILDHNHNGSEKNKNAKTK